MNPTVPTVGDPAQPRERAVPCRDCHRPTWNTGALCDTCTDAANLTRSLGLVIDLGAAS